MTTPRNLDLQCAKVGQEVAKINGLNKGVLNKVLGVLEGEGLYAMFVWLHAQSGGRKTRGGQTPYRCLSNRLSKFLEDESLLSRGRTLPFDRLQGLATDLDTLLFAIDLTRRALIYGRYHAEAGEVRR